MRVGTRRNEVVWGVVGRWGEEIDEKKWRRRKKKSKNNEKKNWDEMEEIENEGKEKYRKIKKRDCELEWKDGIKKGNWNGMKEIVTERKEKESK